MNEPSEYSIRIIRTLEEIEKIRPIWEEFTFHPNAHIDQYITVTKLQPDILHPHVIVINRGGTPVALVIGRVGTLPLYFKLGYAKLFRVKMIALTIVYGGIMGDMSEDVSNLLVNELIRNLRRSEAEIVFFNNIPINSFLYKATKTLPSFFNRDHISMSDIHWKLSLPDSYDDFLARLTKRPRANARNYINRFKKKYGKTSSIKCFKELNDIDIIFKDTEKVARKTYHRGIGVGFYNNKETYEIYKMGLNHHWFRAYIMYINEIPIAFWHGYYYRNTFFTGATGFDLVYRDDRPGTILLLNIIEKFCNEKTITSIDFGFGNAEYKRIYCDQKWEEESVYIFAPTLRGILLNAAKSSLDIISNYAESILNKFNLTDKVKKIWRDKLADSKKDSNESAE